MHAHKQPLGTGLTYNVLEWDGAGGDHTLLLLHGFLDSAWGWTRTVDESRLASRFHILAPDLRGHGDSDWIGAGGYYHFLDYVADLAQLVAAKSRARLSIVGHSMGGMVASYFAGTYPARVERLVLCEGLGPPEGLPTSPERTRDWADSWVRVRQSPPKTMASLDEATERIRRHDARVDEATARFLAEHSTVALADGRLRWKHDPLHATRGPFAFATEIAIRFWRAIACPTLIIDGEHSRNETEEHRVRRSYIANVEARVLPGAGHMMMRHQPAALGAMLSDFLTGS